MTIHFESGRTYKDHLSTGSSTMKRPWIIYPIVMWFGVALLLQVGYVARFAKAHQQPDQPPDPLLGFLPLALLIVAVWLLVGLSQLRRVERWVAVVFFVYWPTVVGWNTIRFSLEPDSRRLALLVFWLIITTPSLLSTAYLSRKTFRDFAVRYVEEKEMEKKRQRIREYAEKQMEKRSRT